MVTCDKASVLEVYQDMWESHLAVCPNMDFLEGQCKDKKSV